MMRKIAIATAFCAAVTAASQAARADMFGAAAGAGTGLLVAGPPGAIVGGVVGAVWGKPFWGPPLGKGECWTDNSFHRHCKKHW